MAGEGGGGGDGRPDEVAVGGDCGGSREGGEEVAAPHRGKLPDGRYVTSQYYFILSSI